MKNLRCKGKVASPNLVLWGAGFEETAAVIFTTALRRAGLPVKVVGLVGPQAAGIHGLALHPDMTLSEALPLAGQTKCVVIPCSPATAHQMENDPRVPLFFKEAVANKAQFILSEPATITVTSLHNLAIPPTHCISYTGHDNLMRLAHTIAIALKNKSRKL